MAKTRKYKRRGRREADSSYKRRGSTKTYRADDQFTESKLSSTLRDISSDRADRVVGPLLAVDDLLMTKRGKRIHILDGDGEVDFSEEDTAGRKNFIEDKTQWYKLSALCGAGRPNKEFPKGSAIPLIAKLPKNMSPEMRNRVKNGVQATCYRCIKLRYMKLMRDAIDEQGEPIEIETREFFPTNEDNRDVHIMIPGGRRGVFGRGWSNLDDADRFRVDSAIEIEEGDDTDIIKGYKRYFETSRWKPGIEEMRTQPASLLYIGNRTPEEIKELLQYQKARETFGKLIREVLGDVVYDNLPPRGANTDNDIAGDKINALLDMRQEIADERYRRASERGKRSKKSNPLLGLSDDLLDGLEMFMRRNYVKSRR
jgi:hypothetical protein